MQLEKYYTCYIERRLHIPYNPASARLTIGLLMFNALIQLKIIQYWWWFWRQWCRDLHQALTGILTEQKLISDCRYRVIKSTSLVPVLFREVFSHPYISFFHLLVNGFSVIYTYVCVCVQENFVIERTRDLIYLKFVATDFFPKIIRPSAGKNSGDSV